MRDRQDVQVKRGCRPLEQGPHGAVALSVVGTDPDDPGGQGALPGRAAGRGGDCGQQHSGRGDGSAFGIWRRRTGGGWCHKSGQRVIAQIDRPQVQQRQGQRCSVSGGRSQGRVQCSGPVGGTGKPDRQNFGLGRPDRMQRPQQQQVGGVCVTQTVRPAYPGQLRRLHIQIARQRCNNSAQQFTGPGRLEMRGKA